MIQQVSNGRKVSIFPANTKSPCVWLNTFTQEAEAVWEACQGLKTPPFALAAIQIDDWNSALSPWPAKAVFKGEQDFAGLAIVSDTCNRPCSIDIQLTLVSGIARICTDVRTCIQNLYTYLLYVITLSQT